MVEEASCEGVVAVEQPDETEGAEESPTDTTIKQQNKEKGRLRALEIAMAKQKLSSTDDTITATKKTGKRATRKSARHGARNQHRHKQFAKWILDTFPHVLQDCSNTNDVGEHRSCKVDATAEKSSTPQKMHVLDVAGGKGELSARLSLCHKLNVRMIDPRPADIESVYMNSVVPKLPNKWQKSIEERMQQAPTFVQDEIKKRFSQLVMPFIAPPYAPSPANEEENTLDDAVRNASLLIGLHADGATEAIVDAALLYRKPFVVVPCCVFPNLFSERYVRVPMDDNGESTPHKKRVPVRTHDQFCQYLLDKDNRFVKEVLPFEGRNIAIWWDGL